jgi:hypothetical protein
LERFIAERRYVRAALCCRRLRRVCCTASQSESENSGENTRSPAPSIASRY